MKEYKKDWMISLRAVLCFTLLTGLVYPVVVTAISMLFFADRASGSLIKQDAQIIGSELIGQTFSQAGYFWSRPSAVKYEGAGSGATNLSLSSQDLIEAVRERESRGAVAEMRFTSASGLDPHISPESAWAQIQRVGLARKLNSDQLKAVELLVRTQTKDRQFGFLGEPTVNVLQLNLKLDSHFGK